MYHNASTDNTRRKLDKVQASGCRDRLAERREQTNTQTATLITISAPLLEVEWQSDYLITFLFH